MSIILLYIYDKVDFQHSYIGVSGVCMYTNLCFFWILDIKGIITHIYNLQSIITESRISMYCAPLLQDIEEHYFDFHI